MASFEDTLNLYTFRESTTQQMQSQAMNVFKKIDNIINKQRKGIHKLKSIQFKAEILNLAVIKMKCPKLKQECNQIMDRFIKSYEHAMDNTTQQSIPMDTDNDKHGQMNSQSQNIPNQSNVSLLMSQTSGYQSSGNNTPRSDYPENILSADLHQNSPSIFKEHNKVYLQRHYYERNSPCSHNQNRASLGSTPIKNPFPQHLFNTPPTVQHMSDPQLFSQSPLSLTPDDIVPLSDYIPLRQPSPPQHFSSEIPEQIFSTSQSQPVFSSSPQHSTDLPSCVNLIRSIETYIQTMSNDSTEVPQTIVTNDLSIKADCQVIHVRDSSTSTSDDQITGELTNHNLIAQCWIERPSYLSFTEAEIEQLARRIGIEEFNFYQLIYELRHNDRNDPNMQSAVVEYSDSTFTSEMDNQQFGNYPELFDFNNIEFDDISVIPPTP